MRGDAALESLFLPLQSGELHLPEGCALFLRARADAWLAQWPREHFVCEQTFKPFADELTRAGVAVEDVDASSRFPLVLVRPPRQRDEARAVLARAVRHATPGGIVVASLPNDEGARSMEADLAQLTGAVRSLSKYKCRVVWTAPLDARVDAALIDAWCALDEPRPITDGRFLSRPGLFAWDRIDTASALLADALPTTLAGRVADLGAGYGYLASEVVARCPQVVAIDLYEAERRALEPARINLDRAVVACRRDVTVGIHWRDVTTGIAMRYDAIVTNPPFHQGRADQPELGRAFIETAASALLPHGALWLVANRHLAYESTLAARFGGVREVLVRDGFKVIEAREPRR